MSRQRFAWRVSDLMVLYLANLAGVVAVGSAWFGASGTDRLDAQLHWVELAVLGSIVAGTANARWLAAGRRNVRHRARALLEAGDRLAVSVAAAATSAVGSDTDVPLVAGTFMTRYHRPGCPLAAGKPVTSAPRATHERSGRRRCEACRP